MKKRVWASLYVAVLALLAGCSGTGAPQVETAEAGSEVNLGPTIGSFVDLVRPEPVTVEGYGLVGGLAGTGSASCPLQIRAYLRQHILTQVPGDKVNPDELINSKNTAVVRLEGLISATPSQGEHFDVLVSLIPGSDATSLSRGWLYKANLVARGTVGVTTRALATVEGPIFVSTMGATEPDVRTGHILGGGRTLYEYRVILSLRRENYRMASAIRNRLSGRYGPNVARAPSPGTIEVLVPPEYRLRKMRFIQMIPATFLTVTPELSQARVDTFARRLITAEDREASEITLEAIGRESLSHLNALLNSSNVEVRFRAARCMLNLGDDRGFHILRELAAETGSPYRLEALDAIVVSARRNDAVALARRLLRDEDVNIVLAAYEHLRRMDDSAVVKEVVGRKFYLEQVVQTDRRAIFVSRRGDPRIVLFGSPLRCRENLFVESPDKAIVLNSKPEQNYVSVIRKHPMRPGIIGPTRTGFGLAGLIRLLGKEPTGSPGGWIDGLDVPYMEVITLLEQMVAREAVDAQFWAGPVPEVGLIIKK